MKTAKKNMKLPPFPVVINTSGYLREKRFPVYGNVILK
jgi:hypothetical protein